MEIARVNGTTDMMDWNNAGFPDIYVVTKMPHLVEELKRVLPPGVKVKNIQIKEQSMNFSKSVAVHPEDIEAVKEAEIVIIDSSLLSKMMYSLPKLKWAQSTWAGVEIIFEGMDSNKPKPTFKLTRCVTPYYGSLMSEYVVAQIINIERGFYNCWDAQKCSQWSWPTFPNFRVLGDLTVGLLGAGTLAKAIAKHLKHEGTKTIGFVKNIKKETIQCGYFDKLVTDLKDILPYCDYICNVLPSTAETTGLLNGNVLKMCEKKPIFINIGRGTIIKEKDIIHALNEGWISKAVLDVFDPEPLYKDSPLWKMPQVIITPHIGGIPRLAASAQFIAENYKRFLTGEKLAQEVNWEHGY